MSANNFDLRKSTTKNKTTDMLLARTNHILIFGICKTFSRRVPLARNKSVMSIRGLACTAPPLNPFVPNIVKYVSSVIAAINVNELTIPNLDFIQVEYSHSFQLNFTGVLVKKMTTGDL